MTRFTKLNKDWNAEPNAPQPRVSVVDEDVVLSFTLNSWLYPQFKEGQTARLRFARCWRFRLGPTNDEGWYRGQCRFGRLAPEWGEFYEVRGPLLEGRVSDWQEGTGARGATSRHFLFYLRDETFECDALGWELEVDDPPGE